MIPRKIHYCWFGGKPLPAIARKCMASWRRMMPDAEIVRWDETNYDFHSIPYAEAAAKDGKWAFVSDYARLDIVYREGGIYLDVDVELLKPLDPLLENHAFCGRESRGDVNTGLVLGGEAGVEIIRDMRDCYLEYEFSDAKGGFSSQPCTTLQTNYLKSAGFDPSDDRVQDVQGLRIFPSEYFSPVDEYGLPTPTANSFSRHYGMASWFPSRWRALRAGRLLAERLLGRTGMKTLVRCKRMLFPEYRQ